MADDRPILLNMTATLPGGEKIEFLGEVRMTVFEEDMPEIVDLGDPPRIVLTNHRRVFIEASSNASGKIFRLTKD